MSNDQIEDLKKNVDVQYTVYCIVPGGSSFVQLLKNKSFDTPEKAELFVLENMQNFFYKLTIIKEYNYVKN